MSAGLDEDAAALAEWWSRHASAADTRVRGLWFGLADLVDDNGEVRRTMYVAGTPEFDADDGGDWACDYVWEPPDRYLALDGLAAFALSDWRAALDHAVEVVRLVEPWTSGPSELRGVGVGFDDGDVHIVWTSA